MKKFLLLLHEDAEKMAKLSPKEMEDLVNAHFAWASKLGESGTMLGGDGLEPNGKLIIGKEAVVKDGLYMESKEIIGGYYLLQAESMEDVVEIAKECPGHLFGGTTEIRPIAEYDD